MKGENGKAIMSLTWCFIMAFLIAWTGSARMVAGGGAGGGAAGGAGALTRTQLPGKYCKILEEIFSQARFECGIEMGAKFRPHNDPSPVRIVLTTTPFFLIPTPFALTRTPFFLTRTRFFLTTTWTVSPLLGEKCTVHSKQWTVNVNVNGKCISYSVFIMTH